MVFSCVYYRKHCFICLTRYMAPLTVTFIDIHQHSFISEKRCFICTTRYMASMIVTFIHFFAATKKTSFVQHGGHQILNKWHPIAIWMLKFSPQISPTRDNFENYVNFIGRTKMTTIVSRTWQCYTRRFFSSSKHLSPQRQTLLVEKANKLRLSHWWGSNIKPFQDSSFMT